MILNEIAKEISYIAFFRSSENKVRGLLFYNSWNDLKQAERRQ